MIGSEIMLSDENKMNKLNPYVDGLVPTFKPFDFELAAPAKKSPAHLDGDQIMKGFEITDDSIAMCPMSRAMSSLEPTREIQPDFQTGSLDELYGNIVIPKDLSTDNPAQIRGGDMKVPKSDNIFLYILLALVSIIALYFLIR